ncbi:EAL domain-containing protein [Celerinatantimonas sp. MCCC 1A17872]|uniref:EAL domain-containing protein n=1 Tax=Celerinatantimonas sp. MCCC 1A17872 TaxID=3177514 RepID=UPI0038BE2346
MGIKKRFKQSQFFNVGILIIIAGFLLASFVAAYKVYQTSRTIAQQPNSAVWGLVQLQEEHRRFINTLQLYKYKGVSKQQLLFRYNILWSRFPVLLDGNESAYLRQISGANALIRDMFSEVQRIEPILEGLPRSEIEIPKILHWLENFSGPVNVLVNREFHRIQESQSRLQAQLLSQQKFLTYALAGLFFCFALLVVVIVIQGYRYRWLRSHDPLSKLLNRRALNNRLQHYLDENIRVVLVGISFEKLAVWMSQLQVNPLAQLSERLKATVRQSLGKAVLEFARFSENEFALVVDAEYYSAQLIDKFYQQLCLTLILAEQSYQLRGKLVLVENIHQLKQAGEGLQRLTLAFEQARSKDEPIYYYRHELVAREQRWIELCEQFQEAIANTHLQILYQPVLRVNHKMPVALQMRLRWIHPQYGRIEHEELLKLAEQTQLTSQLKEHWLALALAQHRYWFSIGHERLMLLFSLPVNWLDEPFIQLLVRKLNEFQIPVQQFMLACQQDNHYVGTTQRYLLKKLHQAGVRILVDDNVANGASWQQLLRSRYEFVRLTVPLSAELTQPQRIMQLDALANFMKELKLTVIFEGVSNREQLYQIETAMPQAYVCGAVFAPYMPAEQTELYLKELLNPAY